MKPSSMWIAAGLFFTLCAICYADDEASFSYHVHPATIRGVTTAAPIAFPGHGCSEPSAFLLPAPFGDAGMNEFVQVDLAWETCAFNVQIPGRSEGSVRGPPEVWRASGTETETNAPRAEVVPASTAMTDLLPREVTLGTKDTVITEKRTDPWSGRSVAYRSGQAPSERGTLPATVHFLRFPSAASSGHYWLPMIVAIIVSLLALLALIGAVATLLYLRWFSERAILARAVNRGLRRNEFHLDYQPIFYTKTRKCIGLEAVLRWKNIVHGVRGEAWVMDKLANSRSIGKLVALILSTAEKELRLIADGRKLYLTVNLSASCLHSEDCLSLITTWAQSFTSARLVLQVRADDLPGRHSSIASLRRAKASIALSGVRTTTSITELVPHADFEFIKLDRSVMGLDESHRLQTLQAIAAAGRQLDLTVIADGVEGVGQYHAVGRARIDLAQGFFLGKAMAADELAAFFEKLEWWQGKHVPTSSRVLKQH